jgi:hypothetical protein
VRGIAEQRQRTGDPAADAFGDERRHGQCSGEQQAAFTGMSVMRGLIVCGYRHAASEDR